MANKNKKPAETVAGVQEEEAARLAEETAASEADKAAKLAEADEKAKADIAAAGAADKDKFEALVREKRAAGLPYELAVDCAKRQIEEDNSGIYQKVRNELSAKPAATTAKA